MRSHSLKSVRGMRKKRIPEVMWRDEVSICQFKYSETKRQNAAKIVR